MRHLKDKLAVRILVAVAVALWFGVAGALGGLGCFYLFPAQYQSTGRVVVSGAGGPEGLARANALVASARSPATLSTAILVADLYRGERDRVALGDLAARLQFTATVTQSYRNATVEVAMTYPDSYRVQHALDSVIRHMVSEDAPRYSRMGSYAMNSRNATAAVRVAGLAPGAALLGGFVLGLLFHAVYAQLRMPKPVDRRLWLQ